MKFTPKPLVTQFGNFSKKPPSGWKRWLSEFVIIHSGMNDTTIKYRAPTKVMRVRTWLMKSAVRLLDECRDETAILRMLSATSFGLKTMDT